MLDEWRGDEEIPETWKIESGRTDVPGHYQSVFYVPKVYWSAVKNCVYKTGVKDANGKEEQIDFRWNGKQSVVYGKHDSGTTYTGTGLDKPVATAPLWMIEKMLKPEYEPKPEPQVRKGQRWDSRNWASSYLEAIDPNLLDWYVWRDCLFGAHDAGLNERDVLEWSERSATHTQEGFNNVWRHIKARTRRSITIGTLGYLAKQNGWVSPFREGSRTPSNLSVVPLRLLGDSAALLIDDIPMAIRELLDKNLGSSALQTRKIKLRQKTTLPEREFDKLWEDTEIDHEGNSEELRDDTKKASNCC